MSPFFRNTLCIIALTYCLSENNIVGQISSATADKKFITAYSAADTTYDSIFVFYQRPNPKMGSLTATDTIKARFEWSKFDTITKTFTAPFHAQDTTKSSTINNLSEGGYKVTIIDTVGKDTSFVAWVAFDSLHIVIKQDNEGFVPYFYSTCDYFQLIVIDSINSSKAPKPVNFKYFDPAKKDTSFEFKNEFRFYWRAKSDQGEPFANGTSNSQRVSGEDIPFEDTDYFVTVSDQFGLTQTNKVRYKSIVPKADFEADPDTSGIENSAPLKVTFTNNSKNAEKYTWYMGDGDTLEINTPDKHNYFTPDTFPITLIAESKEQCTDSMTKKIAVKPPILKVPNVFNPDNNNFTFSTISLHYYKMVIFTRWGKKVYEEEAYDNSEPKGWDGKIGNNYASEGIYYYVIEVRHWDPHPEQNEDENRIKNKGRYAGFFYLFRSGY